MQQYVLCDLKKKFHIFLQRYWLSMEQLVIVRMKIGSNYEIINYK